MKPIRKEGKQEKVLLAWSPEGTHLYNEKLARKLLTVVSEESLGQIRQLTYKMKRKHELTKQQKVLVK
jgi:hypothetical protein